MRIANENNKKYIYIKEKRNEMKCFLLSWHEQTKKEGMSYRDTKLLNKKKKRKQKKKEHKKVNII